MFFLYLYQDTDSIDNFFLFLTNTETSEASVTCFNNLKGAASLLTEEKIQDH